MTYSKSKTIGNSYQGRQSEPKDSNLGLTDTPSGWWAIIGDEKNKANVINPTSQFPGFGTCQSFYSLWGAELNVDQPPIPYYYDTTGNPGTIQCKTTQKDNVNTPVLTCTGAKCCDGDGLNGIIPAGATFQGMVRPNDITKPQCIQNVSPDTSGWKPDISKRTCDNPRGCPDVSNCTLGDTDCVTKSQLACSAQESFPKCLDGSSGNDYYTGLENDCKCSGDDCKLTGTKCCNGCHHPWDSYKPKCKECPSCKGAKPTIACPDWLPEGDPNKNKHSDYWKANNNRHWGGGLTQYCEMDENMGKGSKAATNSPWHDCGKYGGMNYTAMAKWCCPPEP